MSNVDSITRQWIRNPSDEKAVANGCRFDEERAQFVRHWIEKYCALYEGEYAGQKMKLCDWQLEFVMRLFGWVRFDTDWNCEVRRFRKACVYIPKKNKKSPTLAAIGLYLFCGDGELGQKVFTCAKDGKQAMISHRHALEMVRSSKELMAECSINKTTGQICHEETRSFYAVISGDNKEGQEGLNGSLLVDETHVVDAALMKRLSRMGISRKNPLHIEVSTAGNNPDSYGKARFDHAQNIIKGIEQDDQLLAMVYAAPQDIDDKTLDENLLQVCREANPAMGHTVMESEILTDYQNSKKSISDLADFKMYRLNVWQRASNPWLKSSDWQQCGHAFTEEDMRGQSCIGAVDLSRVSDMTALPLLFDGPEITRDGKTLKTIRLLPYFWLPEGYARANNHLVPFLEWAKNGHLRLTPGDVMDYGYVRADIREILRTYDFQMRELVYDEMFAEEFTQALADGVMDKEGKAIEQGIGCKRVVFKQNIISFAKPTEDFEADVIAHALQHNNNPVLNWMAGHCEVYRDPNGNKRPIKPDGKKGGVKKIDGIVAAIMARARFELAETQQPSIFFV